MTYLQRATSCDILQSYLKSRQYKFNTPSFKLQQSFIDPCRFKPPIITPHGIEVQGFLFNPLSFAESNSRDGILEVDKWG
jgi:hypothetical protein